MIPITPTLSLDEREIQEDFVRASGPGGQNVNKVATAVQLRFDLAHSALPEAVRNRLATIAKSRITEEGVLMITSRQFRTQIQNREAAYDLLITLIRQATIAPKPHLKTRPTRASKERRLDAKRRNSEIKKLRRSVPE
jgi:ribosome-associated protein